tara:strand:- start:326 stop:916 length:591 start_codon:yes stop_codon:yes gene_type:complete
MSHDKKNIMVILSSPSGVGKTTLAKKIEQKYENFKISVSHTTRPPRTNEINGIDYHFIQKEQFEKLISENKFYEYAKIFENYYGTLKNDVDETLKKNDLLFDIDWQGTKQLSKIKDLKLIKIYLITEKSELKKRLIKRNQNSKDEIDKRFKSYEDNVKHWNDYDYIIINENLEICFKQIENIILTNKKQISYLHNI